MPDFSEIVETVVSLEPEQMEEIKDIISKALIEKRRASFLKNHQDSLKDAADDGVLFSSNNPTEITQWLKNL